MRTSVCNPTCPVADSEIAPRSEANMVPRARHLTAVCVLGLLAGCGGNPKPETIVRGQILYRGEPLANGLIVLTPDIEHGSDGPPVSTRLLDDGSFTLLSADGKPIPAGWYRIAVAPRAGAV